VGPFFELRLAGQKQKQQQQRQQQKHILVFQAAPCGTAVLPEKKRAQ
jgi:hypothetical protein